MGCSEWVSTRRKARGNNTTLRTTARSSYSVVENSFGAWQLSRDMTTRLARYFVRLSRGHVRRAAALASGCDASGILTSQPEPGCDEHLGYSSFHHSLSRACGRPSSIPRRPCAKRPSYSYGYALVLVLAKQHVARRRRTPSPASGPSGGVKTFPQNRRDETRGRPPARRCRFAARLGQGRS